MNESNRPELAAPMDSPHRRAWDLIPWVVAETASVAEQREVMAHAQACAECRAEIDFHTAVREGVRLPLESPSAEQAGADAAWARMQLRLDTEPEAAAAVGSPGAGWGAAAAHAVPHASAGNTTRWLAAAVVVQAVGLAALAGALVLRPEAGPEYEALSEAVPAAAAVPGPGGIQLVLAGTLTLAELNAVLSGIGWRLSEVSGDGQRFVAVPALAGAAHREAALAALRARPGVLLAEPMPAGGSAR
jgi:hypothetical protein